MVAVSGGDAKNILDQSARAHGNLYHSIAEVEVSYEGEWTKFAKRLQPTLVDAAYRQSSTERYLTESEEIIQEHRGCSGTKSVHRDEVSVNVSYNEVVSTDGEVNDAAALVADAYKVFLFGSSYLSSKGGELEYAGTRAENGTAYHLVQGALVPGLGFSERDEFIAWIAVDSRLLHRFQFTLNGLESTRGADVSVEFSDFSERSGFVVPRVFVEHVERPIRAKAHYWEMTDFHMIKRR